MSERTWSATASTAQTVNWSAYGLSRAETYEELVGFHTLDECAFLERLEDRVRVNSPLAISAALNMAAGVEGRE